MTYSEAEQRNLELVRTMYEKVLMPLDSSQVDRFIAPEYVQHSPLADSGTEPLKRFLDSIKGQFPDAEHRIKRMFADGDHVIAHTHVIRQPGDKGLAVVDIFRVAGDKLVEHWDVIQEIDSSLPDPESIF